MSCRDEYSNRGRLKVVLPPSMSNFFLEPEFVPSSMNDSRRFQRLRIRCRASMIIESSPPGANRSEFKSDVLIQDISRTGIGFLWHEMMHFGEVVFLRFQGRQVRAEVVRCKEIGPRCFECGACMLYFKNLEDADFNIADRNLIRLSK
jgi:PilZ domain